MLNSLTRNLYLHTLKPSFVANCTATSLHRTLYTETALGIEQFKFDQAKTSANLDITKIMNKFQEEVDNKSLHKNTAIHMLFSAKTDEQIGLLIRGLKECNVSPIHEENKKKYYFSAPLMRLLYSLNKTDLALKMLLNEETTMFLSPSASLIVATKLFNEDRYNDLLRLIDHILEKNFYSNNPLIKISITQDLIVLLFASLFKIGDLNALNKMKEYSERIRASRGIIPMNAIAHGVLLALKHNDLDFGNHLLSFLSGLDGSKAKNLKLLLLSRSNITEAVDLLDECRTAAYNDKEIRVYVSTINELRKIIEKANNTELLSRLEAIVSDLKTSRRINRADLGSLILLPNQNTISSILKGRVNNQPNNVGQSNTYQSGKFNRENRGRFDQGTQSVDTRQSSQGSVSASNNPDDLI